MRAILVSLLLGLAPPTLALPGGDLSGLVDPVLAELDAHRRASPTPALVEAWRTQLILLSAMVAELRAPPPEPVPAAAFDEMLARLGRIAFTEDKLIFVDDLAADAWFSVDQVLALMQALHASRRVQVAARLQARVLDRYSWYRVYDGLSRSDRQELRKLLGRPPLR